MRPLALLILVSATGCEALVGIDDPSFSDNAGLGLPCGSDHEDNGFLGQCPGAECINKIEDHADLGDSGFCSTFCQNDADCEEFYAGPGVASCILATNGAIPDRCLIRCTDAGDADCPPPLRCYAVTNDRFETQMVCGGPNWKREGS